MMTDNKGLDPRPVMTDSWAVEPWPEDAHRPLAEIDRDVERVSDMGYDASGKPATLVVTVSDDGVEQATLTMHFDAAGERIEECAGCGYAE